MTKKKRRDPIADYVDWTEHRYDPGYYLGGNLPPYLRKHALGPKGRRLAGLFLAVLAILSLASVVSLVGVASRWEMLFRGGLVALLAAAAVTMYRSGNGTHHGPP